MSKRHSQYPSYWLWSGPWFLFMDLLRGSVWLSLVLFVGLPWFYLYNSQDSFLLHSPRLLLVFAVIVLTLILVTPFVVMGYVYQLLYPEIERQLLKKPPTKISTRELWVSWAKDYWIPTLIALTIVVGGLVVYLTTRKGGLSAFMAALGGLVWAIGPRNSVDFRFRRLAKQEKR